MSNEPAAFHEAGHAAVLIYFGLPIMNVTIVPSEEADGVCTSSTVMGIEFGPDDGPRERRRIARQQILSCYAGLEAQRLVDGHAEPSPVDEESAFELSRDYGVGPRGGAIGDERHIASLGRLRGEARRLVRQLRPAIEVLAAELLRRSTLDGKEAARAVAHLIEPGEGR
jgi:hypothetical protein